MVTAPANRPARVRTLQLGRTLLAVGLVDLPGLAEASAGRYGEADQDLYVEVRLGPLILAAYRTGR